MKESEIIRQLHEAVEWDRTLGTLTWKERPLHHFDGKTYAANAWNARFAGKTAGHKHCIYGRWTIQSGFCGKSRGLHALIWALAYGYFPSQIDHINGDACDNRLHNLREVTITENNRNTRPRPRKDGLPMGIYRQKKGFKVCMKIDGKFVCVGIYTTLAISIAERDLAYIRNGYHANHGKTKLEIANLESLV